MKMRSLIVLSTLLLAACGQKGPLYLPQQPAQPGTGSSATAPASTAPTKTAPTTTAPAAAAPAGSGASVAPDEKTGEQGRQEETQQHTEAEAVSK
ncbi:LPS translocon maturation chaperone LptM [Microbulbifer celer]|uniref:Lipoprotein n=1 Tax=Microbulbifer celer TaxID=435905 RepID=A0ABW3U9H0_9GAMM